MIDDYNDSIAYFNINHFWRKTPNNNKTTLLED